MLHIVVIASGRGSNFEAIANQIDAGLLDAEITLLLSDKPAAPALATAKTRGIPAQAVDATTFADQATYETALLEAIQAVPCDLIVLAGYMRILGAVFIEGADVPIMNIHPSLLPAFPGLHAQKQALDYGVKVAGCTVHFVDGGLDSGPIIAQANVPVLDDDTEATLSARILKEEHRLYSDVIARFAAQRLEVTGRIVRTKEEINDEKRFD